MLPRALRLRVPVLGQWLHAALVVSLLGCGAGGGASGDRGSVGTPARGSSRTYYCQGNEPFWHLRIDGEEATYTTPELATGRRVQGGYLPEAAGAAGRTVWRASAMEDGRTLRVVITEERCLDTMSDRTPPFSHRAELVWSDEPPATGCCRTYDARFRETGE